MEDERWKRSKDRWKMEAGKRDGRREMEDGRNCDDPFFEGAEIRW
jgi:hypothetical protein